MSHAQLKLVHDALETIVYIGVVVAIVAYVVRGHDPVRVFAAHAGLEATV